MKKQIKNSLHKPSKLSFGVYIILMLLITSLGSCQKEISGPMNDSPAGTIKDEKAILVDASRDGGVWWFPQSPSTGFSEKEDHQGKGLADHLRKLGYKVDELPRGAIITTSFLRKYSKVIRAAAFSNYSPDEITAYESFLNESSSLLLMSDHLANTVNDQLSDRLGLNFEGVHMGPAITNFQTHPVTAGVTSLPFIAGSYIRNWDPSKIKVLGTLTVYSGASAITVGAMGVVHHKSSRIFFIGDSNCIETLPEPFTSNLVNWLFK
jgi:hypothetical protein